MNLKIRVLNFEWDEGNKKKNWDKHRVSFRECEEIFFNKPLKIYLDKTHSQKEKRLLGYGITEKGRNLTLIFTVRNKKIRVISARNQSRKERKIYENK